MKQLLDSEVQKKKSLQSTLDMHPELNTKEVQKMILQSQPVLDGQHGALNALIDNKNYQN